MVTRTFSSVAIVAALGLLVPMQVNAFGLGKLELSSALNEPFKAEIAITALKEGDVDNLQVRLASSKEFEQAGIERNFLLTQLKFDVVEKLGRVKIVISSEQPIREPFIDFLLTATTASSGRLIREYTVLLDPPKNIFKKTVTPTGQNPTQNLTKTTTTNQIPQNYQSLGFSRDSYGPITSTDTLWDVALNTRPENNITVQQMMMALLNANPHAFQNNNVNGLKTGYTLTIPSKSDIYKLTKQQAIDSFTKQNVSWNNRNTRQTINADVNKQVVVEPEMTEILVNNKSVAVEADEIITATEDTARLKLVVPEEQSALNDEELSPLGDEKIKMLSEQLSLAQETIEGQTQENIDFKARMDALEEQMETMRRLIALKDADLARLQSMLEDEQRSSENRLSADDATDIKNSDIDLQDESLKAATLNSEFNANQLDSFIDLKTIEEKLKSLFVMAQKFVTNNRTETAIGTVLFLFVMLFIARRHRTDDDAEDNAPTSYTRNESEFFAGPQTQFAADELEKEINVVQAEPLAEEEDVDTETVVEQADMLAAYGDYENASVLLEQAKQQDPTNQSIISKLLFVMFKQQRKEPFIALASTLNIDKHSDEWLDIAKWGRELAPSNTLFYKARDINEPQIILDSDALYSAENESILADPDPVDEVEKENNNTIEFNLDDYKIDDLTYSTDTPVITLDEENNSEPLTLDTSFSLHDQNIKSGFDAPLDFDVDYDIEKTTLSLDSKPLILDLPDEIYSSETFSIDDSALENTPYLDLNTELNVVSEDSDFELDMNDYDEIDEAETKLDLASAYADMGDPDGARNILEEVLKEGNDEQKSKAQTLLKSLS